MEHSRFANNLGESVSFNFSLKGFIGDFVEFEHYEGE